MLIFYLKFSVGGISMWPTVILMMSIEVGSRKLLWPTAIGLFSVLVACSAKDRLKVVFANPQDLI